MTSSKINELEAKLSREKFKGNKLEWGSVIWEIEGVKVPSKGVEDDDNYYIVRDDHPALAEPVTSAIYVERKKDGTASCFECNSKILFETITGSIHTSGLPLSGGGRTLSDNVPYCPKCEEKPKRKGGFSGMKPIGYE